MMDDDPLGLFGTSATPPKTAAPKVSPTSGSAPPLGSPKIQPPMPSTVSVPPKPSTSSSPTDAGSLDLDSLIQDSQAFRPSFPKVDGSVSVTPSKAPTPSFSKSIASAKGSVAKNILSKIWDTIWNLLYVLDPLSRKTKMPVVVLGLIFLLIVASAIGGLTFFLKQPTLAVVNSVAPLHLIQVGTSQISELDVTAYMDLQSKLQTLGFSPVIQMTIPQIASPNFFDVGMKPDVGTYSEIIKEPGQITPRVSFVTVFTNGTWFSTNSGQGQNKVMDYLLSEYYPENTPVDQLYVKHIQKIEQLKQEKDWQPQSISAVRYMTNLSDHLRWFLSTTGMDGYKAELTMWH
jgi:hypothetical protein